jgi:predicted PurR-regulated permease PerM
VTDVFLPTPLPKPNSHPLTVTALCVVAIGALYVGAGIFVPLVLAVLLTFALSPVVRFLHRFGVPQLAAVLITVAVAGVFISLLSFMVVSELAHLAADIPKYQQIVTTKLQALQHSTTSDGVFERIAGGIQGVISSLPGATSGTPPLPVTVVNPTLGPLTFGQVFLGSLLGPLATAAIVVVFVVCLLLEREDFRDRFLKLVSRGDLRTSTRAMNEAGRRVSRYLLVQLTVNAIYGTVFGIGLYFIGIPDALLWGLLTALFRYIPFVGTLIAASLPFALAVAIDPNWGMLFEVAILFFGMELVVTNAIEPRLYGSSTGLSALAVIIAAMFWATLWGPIGLILATPLTVCLVVLGRYVPQLQFLEILLGSAPVMAPEEQFYQRLVSGNTAEAIDLAEEYIARTESPRSFYDDVAIPALRFAESDRSRDGADLAGRRVIAEGMDAVVEEVESLWPGEAPMTTSPLTVLCIGGRTELDGAIASIVAQTIASDAVATRVLPPVSLQPQGIGQIDLRGVDAVCIACLDADPRRYLRYAAKRLKRRASAVHIIGCLFDGAEWNPETLAAETGLNAIATSLEAAQTAIGMLTMGDDVAPIASEGASEGSTSRIRAGQVVNAFAAAVAAEFVVQIAIVLPTQSGDTEAGSPGAIGLAALRDQVLASEGVLVIADTAANGAVSDNEFIVENGFGFFAATKIMDDEQAVGVLMLFDHSHDAFTDDDQSRLQQSADSFFNWGGTINRSRPSPASSDRRVTDKTPVVALAKETRSSGKNAAGKDATVKPKPRASAKAGTKVRSAGPRMKSTTPSDS